jgi:hypothetical protein
VVRDLPSHPIHLCAPVSPEAEGREIADSGRHDTGRSRPNASPNSCTCRDGDATMARSYFQEMP